MVEEAFLLGMKLIKNDQELLIAIRKELRSDRDNYTKDNNRKLSATNSSLNQLEIKKQRLFDLWNKNDPSITSKYMNMQLNHINDEIEILQNEKEEILKNLEEKKIAVKDFQAFMKEFLAIKFSRLWKSGNDEERSIFCQNYVKKIDLFPDHIEINFQNTPAFSVYFVELSSTPGRKKYGFFNVSERGLEPL